MRRGHTSVLLIRQGDDQRPRSPLNTHLRHMQPPPPHTQPAGSQPHRLVLTVLTSRLLPPAPSPHRPLVHTLTFLLFAVDYYTHTELVGQVHGIYVINTMNEAKCMWANMHTYMHTHTDTHTHTHQSLVSHNSTPHHGILHINWCCLVAIFTSTTTPETNTLLSHFPHSGLYQIRAR